MIEGLTAKIGAVEKIVCEGWKEDHTKAGSSSDGDKAKEDRAEESKVEEISLKLTRMTTRAKAKDVQATGGSTSPKPLSTK
ncbi:hypothetical protein Bca52824_000862 [Brassica carinata]|uniref:Uncharacterized protein n=1 Tax=Brassica carinata TaxID=52824 RepID=A0A8X8BD87_BRACI|nr:hypothetical protein Bca52824_000862 [Brassica carinata]